MPLVPFVCLSTIEGPVSTSLCSPFYPHFPRNFSLIRLVHCTYSDQPSFLNQYKTQDVINPQDHILPFKLKMLQYATEEAQWMEKAFIWLWFISKEQLPWKWVRRLLVQNLSVIIATSLLVSISSFLLWQIHREQIN